MQKRRVHVCAGFYLVLLCGAAPAQEVRVPVPPLRPADLSAPATMAAPTAPAASAFAPLAPAPDLTCPRVLADKELVVSAAPPVTGPNGCGIAVPVLLEAVVLADGTRVPFEPPSLIRCDLAAALGDWVRDDIAPAVKSAGGLGKILGSIGHECRTRNRLAAEKLSEHAKGNAVDLRGLALRNGRQVLFQKQAADEPAFLAQIRATACLRFTTVLGPGADAFHAAHLHVDLEQRRHNFRICEWDVDAPAPPSESAALRRGRIDAPKPRP